MSFPDSYLWSPTKTVAKQYRTASVPSKRLNRKSDGAHVRARASRACIACRSCKTKCSGEKPSCKRCARTHQECRYDVPRKDRAKIITDRCRQMAELLLKLRSFASTEDQAKIAEMNATIRAELLDSAQIPYSSMPDLNDHKGARNTQRLDAIKCPGDLKVPPWHLREKDLHQKDRVYTTKYYGMSSAVQWLGAVVMSCHEWIAAEAGDLWKRSCPCTPGPRDTNTYNFWADDESIDLDHDVDPNELPPQETAEILLACYMSKVHDSFPILSRRIFEDQFRRLYTALRHHQTPRLDPRWQSILNLVFSIGASYLQLAKGGPRVCGEVDHVVYSMRARVLGLGESALTSHPSVSQIQGLGLLAFYWLTAGQVSRAWIVIGVAFRSAHALGLHLRNDDPSATASKRERLLRLWWSLHSLEQTLSIITGRSSMIVYPCCSVPLPMPITEEQMSGKTAGEQQSYKEDTRSSSTGQVWLENCNDPLIRYVHLNDADANSGSYFKAAVQLSTITQTILLLLYPVATATRSTEEVQRNISQLQQRLDDWATSLPEVFDFQKPLSKASAFGTRERMLLAFQLCSAKILLTQPYLSTQRQIWEEDHQASFARRMRVICVETAKTVLDLLPGQPCPEFICDQGPWWCFVHLIMQAVSILLLRLSDNPYGTPEYVVLVWYIEKAISWLQAMPGSVASRAYLIAVRLLGVSSRLSPTELSIT